MNSKKRFLESKSEPEFKKTKLCDSSSSRIINYNSIKIIPHKCFEDDQQRGRRAGKVWSKETRGSVKSKSTETIKKLQNNSKKKSKDTNINNSNIERLLDKENQQEKNLQSTNVDSNTINNNTSSSITTVNNKSINLSSEEIIELFKKTLVSDYLEGKDISEIKNIIETIKKNETPDELPYSIKTMNFVIDQVSGIEPDRTIIYKPKNEIIIYENEEELFIKNQKKDDKIDDEFSLNNLYIKSLKTVDDYINDRIEVISFKESMLYSNQSSYDIQSTNKNFKKSNTNQTKEQFDNEILQNKKKQHNKANILTDKNNIYKDFKINSNSQNNENLKKSSLQTEIIKESNNFDDIYFNKFENKKDSDFDSDSDSDSDSESEIKKESDDIKQINSNSKKSNTNYNNKKKSEESDEYEKNNDIYFNGQNIDYHNIVSANFQYWKKWMNINVKKNHDNLKLNNIKKKDICINVSDEQILLSKPFLNLPKCVFGKKCIMLFMKRNDGIDPYIGMSFFAPKILNYIIKGEIQPIQTQYPCYACLCILTGIEINYFRITRTPLFPLGKNSESKTNENNIVKQQKEKQQQIKIPYKKINYPFYHLVGVPGGFRKEAIFRPTSKFSDISIKSFRHFITLQYDGDIIELNVFNKLCNEWQIIKTPTYRIHPDLVYSNEIENYKLVPSTVNFNHQIKVQNFSINYLLRKYLSNHQLIAPTFNEFLCNLDILFGKEETKKRQRGIAIREKSFSDYFSFVKNDIESGRNFVPFKGKVYSLIFTKKFMDTEPYIDFLMDFFRFKNYKENYIKYPMWNLSNKIEVFNIDDVYKNRKIYHILHIKINVAVMLYNLFINQNNDQKHRICQLLCLFIENHENLINYFKSNSSDLKANFIEDQHFLTEEKMKFYLYENDNIQDQEDSDDEYINLNTKKIIKEQLIKNSGINKIERLTFVEDYPSDFILQREDMKFIKKKVQFHFLETPQNRVKKFLTNNQDFDFHKYFQKFFYPLEQAFNSTIKNGIEWLFCENFMISREALRNTTDILSSCENFDYICELIFTSLNCFSFWCPFKFLTVMLLKYDLINFIENCSILLTLLLKINIIEYIANSFIVVDKFKSIVYDLKLIQQTMLDICKHIEITESFNDEHLLKIRIWNKQQLKIGSDDSFYSLFEPHSERYSYYGSLINMAHLIRYTPFLSSKISDNNNGLNRQKVSVGFKDKSRGTMNCIKIFSIAFPKAFQKTNIKRNYREAYFDVSQNREFIKHLYYSSIMMVYNHYKNNSTFKNSYLSFDRMLEFHISMSDKYNEEQFILLMNNNPLFLKIIVAEYLIYMSYADPAYLYCINKFFPEWKEFEISIINICNNIRKCYNENGNFNHVELNICKTKIYNNIKTNKKCGRNWFFCVLNAFKTLDSLIHEIVMEYFTNDNSLTKERINRFYPGRKVKKSERLHAECSINRLLNLGLNCKKISKEKIDLIDRFIFSKAPGTPINFKDFEIVVLLNPKETFIILKSFEQYKLNKFNEIVKLLSYLSVENYDTVNYIFDTLQFRDSIFCSKLPHDIMLQQKRAMEIKYGQNNLPPDKYNLLYARCCGEIKNIMAQSNEKHLNNIQYQGYKDILIHFSTNKSYCFNRQVQKPTKCHSKKFVQQLKKNQNLKLFFNQRIKQGYIFGNMNHKDRFKNRCGTIELIEIYCLGWVISIIDPYSDKIQNFTICPKCGVFTNYSNEMYFLGRFTCNYCNSSEISKNFYYTCIICNSFKSPKNIETFDLYYIYDDQKNNINEMKQICICRNCVKEFVKISSELENLFTPLLKNENLSTTFINDHLLTVNDLKLLYHKEIIIEKSNYQTLKFHNYIQPLKIL